MKRVGVIGGGQLAWMMGSAAKKLGVELVVQTPSPHDPGVSIAQDTVLGAVDDAMSTETLAKKTDVITFENEFVNLDSLSVVENQGVCFRPRLAALTPLLDKYQQRRYLQHLGLPVPRFFAVEEQESLTSQIVDLGFPLVLKSRRHGYDGQGTFIINDLASLQQQLNSHTTTQGLNKSLYLLEEFVPFERELAVIAARSVEGEVMTYPVVETQQEQQVCRRVIAPADITRNQLVEIQGMAHTLLNSLEVVGVFGIELFLTATGKVLVNEIAPRTHNSGHFSLDACETSQFEQHLRAVCGLPLGNPTLRCASAVMVNLLGYEISRSDYRSQRQKLAEIPQAFVYWYGKRESRPGRKLGHVTVLLDEQKRNVISSMVHTIESIWYPS
ncbi:5-(carboxyamino)imidazole ribonucleotide synthase [Umezakia ovalisporum]|jgi:5-(carboxyamino)imidazole ribonucleotide synthase|uniref:N5-carboxyaminoimidazole ribonucleotide synthase n=2 Tax=Umezakia ovalisporum TaxID=75695 RepID=A0AA43H122_9CYAN|nr:5-(carboxyamino)imidazole ribonucleotide synthase [Umezakia ovalisporum]MBI1242890.1 5-(carboxyamino)imidazole ribonucleotide synthase [Nostoc sp. RI_552]MDH6055585.1 5-(carboxyamino)imidazole ribonucleotide synthase [Umezakia ovalisporum FSS-43]MDH6064730.1 5-(carboxyamino)imidazole ribonucleotide synthase [Umezakia ovalisporum FSS-62]MDH6066742.1 5-(carboxyamino)imidazole ribonucleotide synthase [Umezakia ovalisporum APH033B]MDH6069681.1 5-(carboxyamino)imidazole ribonucleotide synthase [